MEGFLYKDVFGKDVYWNPSKFGAGGFVKSVDLSEVNIPINMLQVKILALLYIVNGINLKRGNYDGMVESNHIDNMYSSRCYYY